MALSCVIPAITGCDPDEPQVEESVASFTLAECPVLSAEAGSYAITYTIENPIEGAEVVLSGSSASWLHDLTVDAEAITFEYDVNFGEELREAKFTATYGALDPVEVVVKQAAFDEPFAISFANMTPYSGEVLCTPDNLEATYILCKIDKSLVDAAGSGEAWLKNYVTGTYKHEIILNKGVVPNDNVDNSFTSVEGAGYVIVAGAVRDADFNYTFTTPIYVYEIPFPAQPVLTITALEHNVTCEAGTISIAYTIENKIDGVELQLADTVGWAAVTIDADKINIAYDANDYSIERSASLKFTYQWASDAPVVVINQEANVTEEVYTFTVEVTETHYEYALVNVTPSNPDVKYALKAISKLEYESSLLNADDSELQKYDLNDAYYKPAFLKGAVIAQKVEVSPSEYYGWEWYIYAYAVSDDEKYAISDVEKVLVKVTNDKPTLAFENSSVKVAAAGGKYSFKYVLNNPVNGGVVKFNGTQTNYYNVLKDKSWTINQETCEVEVEVNKFDSSQSSHTATLYIAYYADENATKSLATATLKITQTRN